MPYATLADLIERAGEREILQIADRDRDQVADPDVVDAALTNAANLIDGYVSARYETPLSPVPDLARTWSVSIARYFLYANNRPQEIVDDYKDAISGLKDVAAKRISLPVAEGEEGPADLSGTTLAVHPDQVFTADKLRGW